MLRAVLNTKSYFGGSPFDKDGLDTYQLQDWKSNARLIQINFLRDQGDADQIHMELYDRPFGPDAKRLYQLVTPFRMNNVFNPPIELRGCRLDRLYVRLIALDGTEQNHCKAVFYGEEIHE